MSRRPTAAPVPAPLCPARRTAPATHATATHVTASPATASPAPIRQSQRLIEKKYRTFYIARLNEIKQYEHINNVTDYESSVIKHLLTLVSCHNREERKIVIRVIFEFLSKHTHLLKTYSKFRGVVLAKIGEFQHTISKEPNSVNNLPLTNAIETVGSIIRQMRD
jgi:hypothetical protein